ncbi:MAG: ABC transporter substrate-binding protein, partial [bacterium]
MADAALRGRLAGEAMIEEGGLKVNKIITAALALVLTAGPARAAEKTMISYSSRAYAFLPAEVALVKGFFKDEGLNVEINDFAGGARSLQALVGGSVDVVTGAYEHTINMQAKGQPIVAVALEGRYSGIVLGVRKSKAGQYKSAKDL